MSLVNSWMSERFLHWAEGISWSDLNGQLRSELIACCNLLHQGWHCFSLAIFVFRKSIVYYRESIRT